MNDIASRGRLKPEEVPFATLAEPFRPVARGLPNPRRCSRFELMARRARQVASRDVGELLATLVEPRPGRSSGCRTLWPLWAEERFERAATLYHLAVELDRRGRPESDGCLAHQIDMTVARNLAALFRSLESPPEREVVSCSTVLRETIHDLVALFGPVAGGMELRTDVERLRLPAFQRRALTLAAGALVMDAISCSRCPRVGKTLTVSLRAAGDATACLTVRGGGARFAMNVQRARGGLAGGLAELLGGELAFIPIGGAGGAATIVFALERAEPIDPYRFI